MSGGVEGDLCVADLSFFPVAYCLKCDLSEAMPRDGCGACCGEVALHARAGVVAVAVGDQGAVNGLPRVDVKIASGAVDSAVGEGEDVGHGRDDRACGTWVTGLAVEGAVKGIGGFVNKGNDTKIWFRKSIGL